MRETAKLSNISERSNRLAVFANSCRQADPFAFNPRAFLGPIQSNLRATEKHAPTLRYHLNAERWQIGQENMAVACFQKYRSFIINGSRGLVNCFILL